MATDGPEIDFKHIWKKPSHKNPTGTLICSANALHLSPELGFEEEATDCKPLLIYRSTFEESKDVMDCGKTYKCPSYAGYVTSTSRSRFEVNIAFARKSGHLPAKWQNYSDELVARLYVDGSVEPLEEISILRQCTENPLKMGHYLDDTNHQRQLTWTPLRDTDTYKMRVNYPEAQIDQLSSVRLVISTCDLSGRGRTRSDPIEMDLEADAKAKEEAGAFATTRLTHALTLSSSLPLPTSRKDPLAKRLQQKYVPAIENAVPLVEFNFYYKSNDRLEALRLKHNADFTIIPNPTIHRLSVESSPELKPRVSNSAANLSKPKASIRPPKRGVAIHPTPPQVSQASARVADVVPSTTAGRTPQALPTHNPRPIQAAPHPFSQTAGQSSSSRRRVQQQRSESSPLPDLPPHGSSSKRRTASTRDGVSQRGERPSNLERTLRDSARRDARLNNEKDAESNAERSTSRKRARPDTTGRQEVTGGRNLPERRENDISTTSNGRAPDSTVGPDRHSTLFASRPVSMNAKSARTHSVKTALKAPGSSHSQQESAPSHMSAARVPRRRVRVLPTDISPSSAAYVNRPDAPVAGPSHSQFRHSHLYSGSTLVALGEMQTRQHTSTGHATVPPTPDSTKAEDVLAKLFTKAGRVPPTNALETLHSLGLTGTIGQFMEEQEELGDKHKKYFAAETFSTLEKANWPSIAKFRLLSMLNMEVVKQESVD